MAQPTAQEQYMLELINRARANPSAEAARLNLALNDGLAAGTISSTAKQPLAFNELLIDAARGHSSFLLSSNTFDHVGSGGSSAQSRILQAGYTFANGGSNGENLAWAGSTGPIDETVLIAQEHDDLYRSASHRQNIFAEQYEEIGLGALAGPYTQPSSTTGQPVTFNALITTQKFANSGNSSVFLTGVAFNDAVISDDFYTVGEGLSGVQINAVSSNGQRFTTTTYGSGGYGIEIIPGSYSVFFSGGSLGTQVIQQQATLSSQNVKLDLEVGPNSAPLTTLDPLQYGASHGDLLQAFGVNTSALFEHYLSSGIAEGRTFDSFDEARYLASNGDLINAFGYNLQAATQHYIQSGHGEGRSLTSFDGAQYLASHDDLRAVFSGSTAAATQHYVQFGFNEGRAIDVFDEFRYLASNRDLIAAFGSNGAAATSHYISYGASEGRSLTAFDPNAYLNKYSDIQSAFGSDLAAATRHFVEFGAAEGRFI